MHASDHPVQHGEADTECKQGQGEGQANAKNIKSIQMARVS